MAGVYWGFDRIADVEYNTPVKVGDVLHLLYNEDTSDYVVNRVYTYFYDGRTSELRYDVTPTDTGDPMPFMTS